MRPGPSDYPRPDCLKPPAVCRLHPEQCGNRSECQENATNPGRTHRFFTGTPVVPFGFGLSYTNFSYDVTRVRRSDSLDVFSTVQARLRPFANWPLPPTSEVISLGPVVSHRVTVHNTGRLDADDVVLGFLTPPNAGKDGAPLQSLFDFARIHVPAAASVTVQLNASALHFTQLSANGTRRPVEGLYTLRFGLRETAHLGQGYAEGTYLFAASSAS